MSPHLLRAFYMKRKILAITFLLLFAAPFGYAQKRVANPPTKAVIFAVLNGGRTLEPIAYVIDKKLETAVDGASDEAILKAFHAKYFKPKSTYPLIFGGAKAGMVAVKSSDPKMECSTHTAEVFTTSARTKLKGNVMALATNMAVNSPGNGVRRMPTPAERAEIEILVRAEMTKQKVPAAAIKKLKYQNLTAIDVDNDGVIELVGSFWAEPTAKSRSLLFLIAEKEGDDAYRLGLSDFSTIEEKDTMSEDIASVDGGVYHELLLDLLDYDADGTSEIFTYSPSFEGTGFNVYRREDGKWAKAFEGANYRCGY